MRSAAVTLMPATLRASGYRRSVGQMNGEGKPVSKSNSRMRGGGKAFLPIGIVFLVLAIAMMFSGTTSWIAFFSVGITFLILGTQKPSNKDEPPPRNIPQG
ncbi:hypothetical protein IWX63_002678 [Arthrobacter sp. CAN_A2]